MFLIKKLFNLLRNYQFRELHFDFKDNFLELKIDLQFSLKGKIEKIVKHFFVSFVILENFSVKKDCDFYGVIVKGQVNKLFKLWYEQNFLGKTNFLFEEIYHFTFHELENQFSGMIKKKNKNYQLKKNIKVKYVGQFNKEYLIYLFDKNVLIVDQHAIHERILLNTLLNQKNLENFDEIEILKTMACKNAIKFGQKVNLNFAKKIFKSIFKNKFINCCAHGRYTMHLISFINK
ncbi:DNA mismatch repair [Tubulinosema ratisbonensis]|uniref:DNA mismatch repair n=1 Tax=Tubulinosema ratisbonensis TaxID=291195 RepID=A0A437ANB4_9MICR|nr:DNA mismatch repair [Tubulinosema ratisbonensis]